MKKECVNRGNTPSVLRFKQGRGWGFLTENPSVSLNLSEGGVGGVSTEETAPLSHILSEGGGGGGVAEGT